MTGTYILIVNWNGWRETIECLESVFRIDSPGYKVIVCDNGSDDGSMERIRSWAEGRLEVRGPPDHPLRRLSHPPVPKPIPRVEHDRGLAEKGGSSEDEGARLILVQAGENLGFAGGNNVGLRYALARGDFEYVWLLNNDTVVEPAALSHLLRRMKERPDAGICGSTLPFYSDPERLWARGGATFNKWFATAQCIGLHRPASEREDAESVERRMDYVAGASMLVSRAFLEDVGLLCEDYFLYFEEPDWAARAKGRHRLAYAPGSVVYHKVGASMEDFGKSRNDEQAARDLNLENALRFTRKFHPWAVPTVWLTVQAARALFFCRKGWRRICP